MTKQIPPLRSLGVAILISYWSGLCPPKNGGPGIECSGCGSVTVRAVGYEHGSAEQRSALDGARRACKDAGLIIEGPAEGRHPGFVVRRRHTTA